MHIPLYHIVAEKILGRILRGEYPPGSVLPPGVLLEQEFQVSRMTIRQALGLLKRRGILYSRPGVGTIVRSPGPTPHSMRMTGSLKDLMNYGAETEYLPVDAELVRPPGRVAQIMDLPEKERVLRFRGIRCWPGEVRFGLEEVYIPEPLGRRIDNTRLGGRTFFSWLEEIHGFQIVEANQEITAVAAPTYVSSYLEIRSRSPVLRVTRVYKTTDGRAVEVAVSHYDVRKFQYVMTLYAE